MLKLLTFAVCEKVVADASGNASLIGLLNEIMIDLPPDGTILPLEALAAKEWGIFAMWSVDPEDFGHDFTQHLEIAFPDGTIFKHQNIPFHVKPHVKLATNTANIFGMPIGRAGKHSVTIWLEGIGEFDRARYSYPFFVIHRAAGAPIIQP